MQGFDCNTVIITDIDPLLSTYKAEFVTFGVAILDTFDQEQKGLLKATPKVASYVLIMKYCDHNCM